MVKRAGGVSLHAMQVPSMDKPLFLEGLQRLRRRRDYGPATQNARTMSTSTAKALRDCVVIA